jgi:hypothetical protein
MAEGYTKLLSSITDSSVWKEDDRTLRVWIAMMAMADRDGYIWASVDGLARRAIVSEEEALAALAKFMAPDPKSRSKEYEGRRIEEVDRGWLMLNHTRFRDMRDEDEHRKKERERKRAQRAKEKREREELAAAEREGAGINARREAEPVNDFDGSPNETTCPPLLDDFERLVAPEMVKKLPGVTREQLTASANRFIGYYTIGKGMNQRRRFWMRELRNWIVKDHGAGKLAGPKRREPRNAADALYARAQATLAQERKAAAE